MSKDASRKVLSVFGILSYVGAGIIALGAIAFLFNLVPEFGNKMIEVMKEQGTAIPAGVTEAQMGQAFNIVFGIIMLLIAAYSAFCGWALRRAAKHDKTTLAFVLEIIGLVFGILGLIGAFNPSNIISVLVSAFLVYCVYNIRKA